MPATILTPEAKTLLSTTIRKLRDLLLEEVRVAADAAYQLSIPEKKAAASLAEAQREKRRRLEAWIEEQARAAKVKGAKDEAAVRTRVLRTAEKDSAATFLNRIVLLRHLEALGLSRPLVVTGGYKSAGFISEFQGFANALLLDKSDPSRGYALLLQLLFDELALDLPGLYGDVGLTRLFPVPESAIRATLEALDNPALASAWGDSTTLGWVYQYWNDPEREALDAKINDGGKIEPHEIASKTQMFTERYMVEWLLQNSLGPTWLAIGRKNGWTLDAESVLPGLDERRAAWRKKREAGEVELDALMPIEGELEDLWKYYVPQPIPEDVIEKSPASIRDVKLLDPACGSGHFLVIAFEMLVAMHREEDRHCGETRSDRAIAEAILEDNLFGVDIDPRAIQIAAAGLLVRAKRLAKESRPKRVNLVAPALQLGKLAEDDEALVRLRREVKEETGIPPELTQRLVTALAGVDHLGTLLKVDAAVDNAIREHELNLRAGKQLGLGAPAEKTARHPSEQTRATLLEKLEAFLSRHAKEEDLGLRLGGEQLAAGVRFVRIVKEGAYDVVVGNPPYHGINKLADSAYYVAQYPDAKTDLFAGFFLRGFELLRAAGRCGLVTLSNWMFLTTFTPFRTRAREKHFATLADFGKAAFTTGGTLISTSAAIFCNHDAAPGSVAIRPHPPEEVVRDDGQPRRTEAALLLQRGRYDFDAQGFDAIEGAPIVYWWTPEFLQLYRTARKLHEVAEVRQGVSTADNQRFIRSVWELTLDTRLLTTRNEPVRDMPWVPHSMGASGRSWIEPLSDVVLWRDAGLELKLFDGSVIRNPHCFFRRGVAFSMIGSSFTARAHRFIGICNQKGSSAFLRSSTDSLASLVCVMNSPLARFTLQSLNPGIGFEVGDVNRLPLFSVDSADSIYSTLEQAFTESEAARESSVEFRQPGATPWAYAQAWAERAVDRRAGEPLPEYTPCYESPKSADFISYAVGLALGRFPLHGRDLSKALPDGILYLSAATEFDSLAHPACAALTSAWAEHGTAVGGKGDLRTYLQKLFFKHHKTVYDSRPIYLPLSSANRTFVAWISIHRWKANTLQTLLSEHLSPELTRLEGRRADALNKAKESKGSAKTEAESRYANLSSATTELQGFIALVAAIADKGPPPLAGAKPREADPPYVMDLDDGVMVNSSALWPLLEPQWKEPKKWWKELANAEGRKDYDWSHLAERYFPRRVDDKCKKDPSLAVAHKRFWRYHPARAYASELRLQDEIGPDFVIGEPDSDEARARFLANHEAEAKEIATKEAKRRAKKKDAKNDEEQTSLDYGEEPAETDDGDDEAVA